MAAVGHPCLSVHGGSRVLDDEESRSSLSSGAVRRASLGMAIGKNKRGASQAREFAGLPVTPLTWTCKGEGADCISWKQNIGLQSTVKFLQLSGQGARLSLQKSFRMTRAATTEDVEAEKELIEEDAMERMEKSLESVKGNFNTVRTGRANPSLLDRVEVEYYGSPVNLKSLAQISTPDGSTILVQPFDKSCLNSIERAISKSDVGLNPNNDGNVIRLFIPPLTSERRKDLLKLVAKLSEEGKIAIRNIRRDAIKSYEKLEKEKKLSEDNVKDLSNAMQKMTDEYVKKIDEMFKQKEKELLTV